MLRMLAGVLEMTRGVSMRALYGVSACAAQLSGLKGRDKADEGCLGGVAAQALLQQYAQRAPDSLPAVKAMLGGQGLL